MDNDHYSFSDDEELWQNNTVTTYDSNHVTPISHHTARPIRHCLPAGNQSYSRSDSYYPYSYEFHNDVMPRGTPHNSIAKLVE